MSINQLIAGGGTPIKLENPINNALGIARLREQDLTNNEMERQALNRNMLNQVAKKYTNDQGVTDYKSMAAELSKGGNWDLSGVAIGKGQEQDKFELDQATQRQAKRDAFLQTASTKDQILQWHKANHLDPYTNKKLVESGVTYEQGIPSIESLNTPEQIEEFKAKALLGSKDFFTYLHNNATLAETTRSRQAAESHQTASLAEQSRHNKAMEGGEKQTELDAESANLLGKAMVENRVDSAMVTNKTALNATIQALKADPNVNLVANREKTKSESQKTKLSNADIAKREANFEKATSATSRVENEIDKQISTIDSLIGNPETGNPGNIPGLKGITGIYDQFKASDLLFSSGDTRRARTAHEFLVGNSALNALTDLRNSSVSGGGLGSISNADMELLKRAASKLDLAQDPEDYAAAAREFRAALLEVKARAQKQYNDTYAYKNDQPAAPASNFDDGFGEVKIK